jgi:hypothetical protein
VYIEWEAKRIHHPSQPCELLLAVLPRLNPGTAVVTSGAFPPSLARPAEALVMTSPGPSGTQTACFDDLSFCPLLQ